MSDDRILRFPPPPEAPQAPEAPPWDEASLAEGSTAPPTPPAPPEPFDAPIDADPSSVDTPALLRRRRPSKEANEPSGGVVPFRRRGGDRRIRRLRRHPLVRWVGPLAQAICLVALPVLFAAWIVVSPRFALAEVRVHPDPEAAESRRVDAAWVEAAVAPLIGESVWTLPLDQIEAMLKRHPWIDSIGLAKNPPSTLDVRIVEKRQAALWRAGDQILTIDPTGQPIAPFDASDSRNADLALITGNAGDLAAAIAFLDDLESIDPSWLADLSEIEILGGDDYRVHTADLPFPLLLRQRDTPSLESKCRYLQALLPRLLERFDGVDVVDLRFARRIIVEPSGGHPRDVA